MLADCVSTTQLFPSRNKSDLGLFFFPSQNGKDVFNPTLIWQRIRRLTFSLSCRQLKKVSVQTIYFLFVFCFFGSRGHDFHICLFVLCCVKLWVMSSFSPAVSSAQMFCRIVLFFLHYQKGGKEEEAEELKDGRWPPISVSVKCQFAASPCILVQIICLKF